MSDNTEQVERVEQITKVPSMEGRVVAPKREKDPKRVAAGKKLAESNKRMREEHARYKASEEERRISEAQRVPETTEYETETSGDLPSQLTLTNVISLVSIGLTVYVIFFKKSGNTEGRVVGGEHVAQRDESWQEPVETTLRGEHHGGTRPEVDVRPKPKFGM